MATLEQALIQRLLETNSLEGFVDDRIHWDEQPQGNPLPTITLLTVTNDRPQHLKGYQGTRETRVQCDVRADTTELALAIARAVIYALEPAGNFNGHRFGRTSAEGPRTLNEDLNGNLIHRQSVDLLIWHVGD